MTILSTTTAFGQADTIAAGVYKWEVVQPGTVSGSTADLAKFKVHASTLQPGKTNHSLRALDNTEEIIFVKEGILKVNINDSSKQLGPGSLVLIMAGDKQNFENVSGKPVTYCVLSFQSKQGVDIARGKKSGSLMLDWNNLVARKTEKGESRPIFDTQSSMFPRFETHATTLNAGIESHAPHKHPQEEIMFVMKGTVTAQIEGKTTVANAGDMIYVSPNILHNVKNTGDGQCWYYAIKWFPAGK